MKNKYQNKQFNHSLQLVLVMIIRIISVINLLIKLYKLIIQLFEIIDNLPIG